METEAAVPASGGLRSIRSRSREVGRSRSTARIVVSTVAGTYAFAFVAAAVVHYMVFRSPHNDLGNMSQAVWSTSHGHFLEMTAMSGRQISRLAVHVEPFLILLVPLWWLWGSPMLLVVVQAIAVCTGAFPVFWLGRKHLGSERAAMHFAVAYLIFPATQFNAFDPSSGFHAVSLAVPFILFAIWFLYEDRLALFALFALLACSTGEQIPAAVGCLGIWYGLRRGRWAVALSIFGLGMSASLLNFLLIIPHFARSGIDPFAGRYKAVGGTPHGMLNTLVSDPAAFVHAVGTTHKLLFLFLLFLPFLGYWLRQPSLLLGAVPQLSIDLLSSRPEQSAIPYHYTSGVVPFVVAASIFGAARLSGDPGRISFYTLVAVACTAVYSPLLVARSDLAALSSPVRATKAHALSLIPSGAPVSASNQLGSALSARRYSFVFPTVGSGAWILVDRADPTYIDPAAYVRSIRAVESNAAWKTVYSLDGVTLLRRDDAQAQAIRRSARR
jgi:uncharacterized membrane protein